MVNVIQSYFAQEGGKDGGGVLNRQQVTQVMVTEGARLSAEGRV
jgi:hypothetical protein